MPYELLACYPRILTFLCYDSYLDSKSCLLTFPLNYNMFD